MNHLRDKSDLEVWEYLLYTIYFALLGRFVYNACLFRCIEGLTVKQSILTLWGMMAVIILFSVIYSCKYHKTFWTALCTAYLPLGLYTLIVNRKLLGTLSRFLFFGFCIFLFAYFMLIIFRKIKNKANRNRIIRYRIYKCIHMTHMMFAFFTILIMLHFFFALFTGDSLVQTSTKAEVGEEYTIANQMETLQMLKPELWYNLSAKEKLNVLQTVANIEATYLGLPDELTVSTAILEEYVNGEYCENTRTINIDASHLESSTPQSLIATVCHEAYHSYQHVITEAYQNADESFKNLLLFYDASVYQEEFANYDDGSNGLETYYYQQVEVDARSYASEATGEYIKRIYSTDQSE